MLKKLSYRDLIYFALPSVLGSMVEPLASVVDTALVGRLSTSWLAALAICVVIFNSLTWIFNFLIHLSTQKIADYNAQSNPALLARRIFIALSTSFIVSLLAMAILYFGRHQFYLFAGANKGQFSLLDQYYNIRVSGHFLALCFITSVSIMRGMGMVKHAFFVTIIATGSNIFLSALFLYKFEYGLAGAAWGTICSYAIGVVLTLGLIFGKNKNLLSLVLKAKPKRDEWVGFGQQSFNVFGRSLALTSCFFLATRCASSLGIKALAVHQILLQLWLFCSFFIDGLATSANILSSYYIGKKDYKNAAKSSRYFVVIASFLGLGFTLTYAFFSDTIIGLFTNDLEVLAMALTLMPLIYGSQIVSSIAFIYDGILFGLGKFLYLRNMMIGGAIGIFLPFIAIAYAREKLIWVWVGLIALNIYRTLMNYYSTRKYYKLSFLKGQQ